MPIAVHCPSCSTKMAAPDSSAGHQVMCPNCRATLDVPGGDYEVVDATRKLARRAAKRNVAPKDEYEVVDHADDDTDEDDDDRPNSRDRNTRLRDRLKKQSLQSRRKPTSKWNWKIIGIGGVVALIAIPGIAFFCWLFLPSFFGYVRESTGGFSVALPGKALKGTINVDGRRITDLERVVWVSSYYPNKGQFNNGTSISVESVSFPPYLSTEPDQLEALIPYCNHGYEGGLGNEIVSRKKVSLGGNAGFEVRTRHNPEWKHGGVPKESFENFDHVIYCVTTNGKRIIVFTFRKKGPEWNESMIQQIYDSFSFI